jgi:4'-phosphopantetheinyl transferase
MSRSITTLHLTQSPLEPPAPTWLTPSEQVRLSTLNAATRRAQFLAARWQMRQLLAQVHGGDPLADWPLTATLDGPPQLARTIAQPLYLSISHSGDWVACAASTEPVGVDVECTRRQRNVLALSRLACSEAETAQLAALPSPEREALFYRLWTLKEAWFKRDAPACALHRLEPEACTQSEIANEAANLKPNAWTWQSGPLTLAVAGPPCQWLVGTQPWAGVLPQPWHTRERSAVAR